MSFLEKNLPAVIGLKADIDRLQTIKRQMLGIPFDLWSPVESTDVRTGEKVQNPEMTAAIVNFDAQIMRDVAREAIIKELDKRISDCREAMRRFGVILEGEEPKEGRKPRKPPIANATNLKVIGSK